MAASVELGRESSGNVVYGGGRSKDGNKGPARRDRLLDGYRAVREIFLVDARNNAHKGGEPA